MKIFRDMKRSSLKSLKRLSQGSKSLGQGKGLKSSGGLRSSGNSLSAGGSIKMVSSKQSKISTKLSSVYKEMESRDGVCTGCGTSSNLEHSHLIPRSKRRDLITEADNITFHCNSCHLIWEHGTLQEMKELDDFLGNMDYIKEVDRTYYNIIMLNR